MNRADLSKTKMPEPRPVLKMLLKRSDELAGVPTRPFAETVTARAKHDPEFRNGLLDEAIEAIDRGEADVAKILIRDYQGASK